MPSACVKTEMKTSSEAQEPIGQALSSVEKKIRNLDKKRQKLDGYREKKVLNEDQKEALAKYDNILGNLEFAREMQKHLAQLQAETERSVKKQAKRESHERQLREIQRTKELLGIQSILDSFGPEAKEDFKNSTNGAVSLTEAELSHLDKLYTLISPTRGDGNYEESSSQAGEHIVNLLDARDKEVIGTTYKTLRELLTKISSCGYFDKTEEEETEETPAAESEEQEQPEESAAPAVTEDFPPAPLEEPAPTQLESAPVIEETTQQQPPQTFSLPEEQTTEHTLQSQGQAPAQMAAPEHQAGDFVPQDDSFFTTPAYQATAPRPFQEIVSSVQGSFNFLQESEIEHANSQQQQQQQQAGRVDPAVVAVIPGSMNAAPAESYQSPAFSQDTTTLQYQQTNTQQEAAKESLDTLSQQAQLSETVSSTQALPTNTLVDQTAPEAFTANTDQGFGQQSYSSLTSNQFGADQSTLSFRSEPSPATFGETSFAHVAAGSQNTESGPPQPIPMPPRSYDQQQQDNTQLNPNADIFRSMLTQPSDTYPQSSSLQSTADTSNQDSGSGFGGYRNNREGGRGSRGGPRGGNMSNGYRGGRDNRGGYRGGDRGGYNQRQGGRGGSTYQGYPPRDNYRPEGFQGYNNGFSQGKRGGPANSGGMGGRGGQSRGGMRGGRGGGYGGGRPNSGHSQQ